MTQYLTDGDRQFFRRHGVEIPAPADIARREKEERQRKRNRNTLWFTYAGVGLIVIALLGVIAVLIWAAVQPESPAQLARDKQEQAQEQAAEQQQQAANKAAQDAADKQAADSAATKAQQAKICAVLLDSWNSPVDTTNVLQHVQVEDAWNSECRTP